MPTTICKGVYQIVAHNNNLYFSVYDSPLSKDGYGVIEYNINTKSYRMFCDLDIRNLTENFFFTDDGFLTSMDSKLIFIDFNGNKEIKHQYDGELNESIIKVDDSTIKIHIMDLLNGSYYSEIGYIQINLTDYSVNEYLD